MYEQPIDCPDEGVFPTSVAELLLESGAAECCEACGGVSAYAWGDADEDAGIAHIPCTSCWEWQCGHCGAHHVDRDAPILAECYTHTECEPV